MSDELYLIAHKVRGAPAFDVAIHMTCPHCDGMPTLPDGTDCHQCDGAGHWWIIPTSGHRAFPWLWTKLSEFTNSDGYNATNWGEMPDGWRDHYTTTREASLDLASALGLNKSKPQVLIKRRF